MTENLRGAVLMVLSMAAFTFNDAFFKLAGETLPLFQAMFLRGIVTTIFLCGLCYHLRAIRWNFSRADWQLLILRTLSEVGAAYFFLTALLNMPLANAAAILQMLPLTVTLGGGFVFRRTRRLAALFGYCDGFIRDGAHRKPNCRRV